MRLIPRGCLEVLCIHCRGTVPRGAAFTCAREDCGARYHPACWRECRRRHGSCAAPDCRSANVTQPAGLPTRVDDTASAIRHAVPTFLVAVIAGAILCSMLFVGGGLKYRQVDVLANAATVA